MDTILICHHGALGDFILIWPALHSLKTSMPEYHFLGIGRREYMHIATRLGLLDSCRDMESTRMSGFFSGRALPPYLNQPAGAVLWLSEGEDCAQLLRKTAHVPVVVIKPFPDIHHHIAHYYFDIVQSRFHLSNSFINTFSLPITKGHHALIHPGSGSVTKNYSPDLYRRIKNSLIQHGFNTVGFVFGPAEHEREMGQAFSDEWHIEPENVSELADILAQARLVIGNDSGVSHLSAILGTQTLTLYKKTDPTIWGTIGKDGTHITGEDEEIVYTKIEKYLKENTI